MFGYHTTSSPWLSVRRHPGAPAAGGQRVRHTQRHTDATLRHAACVTRPGQGGGPSARHTPPAARTRTPLCTSASGSLWSRTVPVASVRADTRRPHQARRPHRARRPRPVSVTASLQSPAPATSRRVLPRRRPPGSAGDGAPHTVSDRVLCVWHVIEVGYTMRDILYVWKDGASSVGMSSEVQLPQFRVLGHRQRATVVTLSTGNYSRLACEIQFVRSMGYYLIQIYIPSGLIVIISWVSFWLNRNATPARVQLGVTTVLTMTTLMSSTNAALPKISYVKSIDVYLGTCFVMVFTSLLEYATVGYMSKRIQMRKQRFVAIQKIMSEKKLPVDCPPPWDPHTLAKMSTLSRCPPGRPSQEVRYKVRDPKAHSKGGTLENTINRSRSGIEEESLGAPAHPLQPGKDIGKFLGMTPSDIDKYSRIVFPVCFVCFNLMYWIVYLHVSDVVADDLVLLEDK
ncbi:hypothetical protein O3G_MSEX015264 [Manduca sexta]|uniref:Neurotransmitter-gated ion-channel transmembrane domain-containing protein n=1 Tax=Manduca sexta TaxID=7130 RepID=A0A922A090_MANSE|nr:hypothetical protein O3G_MSEX015264 [Manduca sexta]KAG6465609.1 hypothetical protein O3G_MSEX015264 [Manduca sexta]KAG6465610.1 hypothetical protein O3G_MSEX015264 [Manduca sexta]